MKRIILAIIIGILAFQNAYSQNYCASGGTSTFDTEIHNVTLPGNTVTINQSSSGGGTYTDYTVSAPTADLSLGGAYTLSVLLGTNGTVQYGKSFAAYIDFNDDGDFLDPNENIGTGGPIAYGTTPSVINIPFTVPVNASAGITTRLRVVCQETSSPTSITPCGTFFYGETEDYSIKISSHDVSIEPLVSPKSNSCVVSQDSLIVEYCNTGIFPEVNFTIAGQFANDTFSKYITDTLFPGECESINFGIVDQSSAGNYVYDFRHDLSTDESRSNDTLRGTLVKLEIPEVSLDDFHSCDNYDGMLVSNSSTYSAWWYDLDGNWLFGDEDTIMSGFVTTPTSYVVVGANGYEYSEAMISGANYAGNIQCDGGNMFTITPKKMIRIKGFNAHINTNTSAALYMKEGTYVGHESNSGDWTSIGGAAITPNDYYVPVAASSNVILQPGVTYSFYVNAPTTIFSQISTAGSVFENSDVLMEMGVGLCASFGSVLRNMAFDGDVIYDVITPACASEPDTLFLNITTSPYVELGNDTSYCDKNIVYLDAGAGAGYQYLWSNNELTQKIDPTLSGSYSVTVTDTMGCVTSDQIYVSELPTPEVNLGKDTIPCESLTYLLNAGSGNNYIYNWNNGFNGQIQVIDSAYNYSVTVTNQYGCTATDEIFVNITKPMSLQSIAIDSIACFGDNSGGVDITMTGGLAPLTYMWDNGSTNEDLTGLMSGIYNLTVTDSRGCVRKIAGIGVSGPGEIKFNPVVTNPKCNGDDDGAIDMNITGGTSPFTYSWSSGQSTEDLTGLAPNVYVLSVIDANGCTKTSSSYSITEPDAINANVTKNDITCFGKNNGSISLSITGGTPQYSVLWSNNKTTMNLVNLTPGTYTGTITDKNNCMVQLSALNVVQPDEIMVVDSMVSPKCSDSDDGEIHLSVTGGVPGYTYEWTDGSTGSSLLGVPAGSYNVAVFDMNGCVKSINKKLIGPSPLRASGVDITNAAGLNNGSIQLTITGGTAPYSYTWSNGQTGSATATNLGVGTYSCVVTDANNCSYTISNLQVGGFSSTSNISFVEDLNVYPNPVSSDLYVDIKLTQVSDLELGLYDMNGRQLYHEAYSKISNDIFTLSADDLAEGMYFIRLNIGDQVINQKILVQR